MKTTIAWVFGISFLLAALGFQVWESWKNRLILLKPAVAVSEKVVDRSKVIEIGDTVLYNADWAGTREGKVLEVSTCGRYFRIEGYPEAIGKSRIRAIMIKGDSNGGKK